MELLASSSWSNSIISHGHSRLFLCSWPLFEGELGTLNWCKQEGLHSWGSHMVCWEYPVHPNTSTMIRQTVVVQECMRNQVLSTDLDIILAT